MAAHALPFALRFDPVGVVSNMRLVCRQESSETVGKEQGVALG